MVRFEKLYCRKRLFDRDFLYGVSQNSGFVKDPEAFFSGPAENSSSDREMDEDTCKGTDEETVL